MKGFYRRSKLDFRKHTLTYSVGNSAPHAGLLEYGYTHEGKRQEKRRRRDERGRQYKSRQKPRREAKPPGFEMGPWLGGKGFMRKALYSLEGKFVEMARARIQKGIERHWKKMKAA
jgi:hypothetical protein